MHPYKYIHLYKYISTFFCSFKIQAALEKNTFLELIHSVVYQKKKCSLSATFKSHRLILCAPQGVGDICSASDYLNNRGMGRMWQIPCEAHHLALKAMFVLA